jgi:hypothetical protein
MKLKMIIQNVFLLTSFLFFAACESTTGSDLLKVDSIYHIRINTTENGKITAIPESGPEGTEINFLVNPHPGYKLEVDSLAFHIQGISTLGNENNGLIPLDTRKYDMPAGGGWITANFIPVSRGEYTVSFNSSTNGNVTAFPLYGKLGTEIHRRILPESGYALKEGYPKINGVSIAGPPYRFTIGYNNVTVTAEFERKDAGSFVENGRRSLSAGEYDTAFNYYEAAYQADNKNPEAVIYSTIGKILAILNNPRMRQILASFGFERVPGSLNEWFDDRLGTGYWLKMYDDDILPILATPGGFPMGFINYSVYQVNNANGKNGGPSRALFDLLLFWNLIGNNPDGFDKLLADLYETIFSDNFETAVARTENLGFNEAVVLNEKIRVPLKLDKVYHEGDSIGRAELEVIIASLYSLKATLEWVRSYSWEMDFSILRCSVSYGDRFNEILKMIYTSTLLDKINSMGNYSCLGKFLPLRNNFLRNKDNGMMSKARADFSLALTILIDSFEYISPNVKQKLDNTNEYKWIRDACNSLKTALEKNDFFYFSTELPGRGEPWVTRDDADYGINIDKLFTAGFLDLNKLIDTENGGKSPVFYGFKKGDVEGIPITSMETNMKQYDIFDFGLNLNHLSQIIVKGLEGKRWTHDQFSEVWLNNGNGSWLYDYYQRR